MLYEEWSFIQEVRGTCYMWSGLLYIGVRGTCYMRRGVHVI